MIRSIHAGIRSITSMKFLTAATMFLLAAGQAGAASPHAQMHGGMHQPMHGGMMAPAAASSSASTGDATEQGAHIYASTCAACHGMDGTGNVPGAPDFNDPAGVLQQSDSVLTQRITEGFQSPGSPMAMPPKGGNPDLSSEDVAHVLAYLHATFGHAGSH